MKKLFLIAAALFWVNHIFAQQNIFIPGYDKDPDDEPVELFMPYETVFSGRELPRSFTVSYPDEDSAMYGSLEPSLYLQPMDADPQVTESDQFIEYTWTYKVPFAWVGRQVIVYIGSADNPYHVIINGEKAANNQSSRSAAEFDITTLSKEGVNTLTVRVEKDPAASVLTGTKGTGLITGKIYVKSQPRIRVRDYVAEANFNSDEDPTLQLGIILKTHMLNPRSVHIHYTLKDSKGVTVASGHREAEVGKKEEDTVRFFTPVKDLKEWSYETPHVYDLIVRNQYEGRNTEYVKYKVGFRSVYMEDGSLYTNGYKLPLAFHMMNAAVENESLYDVLWEIRNNGHNVIVVPGFPQSEEFYAVCDELGLYVCNQADINTSTAGDSRAAEGNPSNDPRWMESFVDRAVTMYGTSCSHPSLAMFSIARQSANGYNLYKSYLSLKAMKDRRPVIYPEAEGEWNSDAVTRDFARLYPEAVGERIIFDPFKKETIFPQKPAYAELTIESGGTCRVSNNSFVTSLRGTVNYSIKNGRKKVSEGTLEVNAGPGEESVVTIPVPSGITGKKIKFEAVLTSNFDGFIPPR